MGKIALLFAMILLPALSWAMTPEPVQPLAPVIGGRLCLPDSAGAGPGRLPALLGLPSGRTKSPLTLKTLTLKPAARQNLLAFPATGSRHVPGLESNL